LRELQEYKKFARVVIPAAGQRFLAPGVLDFARDIVHGTHALVNEYGEEKMYTIVIVMCSLQAPFNCLTLTWPNQENCIDYMARAQDTAEGLGYQLKSASCAISRS
jgi:hypothetical protein